MRKAARRNTSKRDMGIIAALIVAAVGLIIYLVTQSGAGKDQAQANDKPQPQDEQAKKVSEIINHRVPDDPLALGKVDAPVVLVSYSDFRCPFCSKFARDTEPELIKRYVDTGKLRIEWRDFPLFGEQSVNAAKAGRAAAAQGKYREFSAGINAAAPEKGHADLPNETLRKFAEQAGVPNLDRFMAELQSPQYDEAVQADLTEGQSLGVESTPTFVINGHPVSGAQPLDDFTKVIDGELEQNSR